MVVTELANPRLLTQGCWREEVRAVTHASAVGTSREAQVLTMELVAVSIPRKSTAVVFESPPPRCLSATFLKSYLELLQLLHGQVHSATAMRIAVRRSG